MLRFSSEGSASFTYEVDFSIESYANLSFFATNRRDIPFHLSLRQGKGLLVSNARASGHWLGEKPLPVEFAEGQSQKVEIAFGENGLSVTLNGDCLIKDASGFENLDKIRYVNWRGGIPDDRITIAGEKNEQREGLGEIQVASGFRISGWAFDPGSRVQDIAIRIDGLEEQPRVHVTAAPVRAANLGAATEMLSLRANLPGRIWTAADDEGTLYIQATSNGIPCGDPITLTRETILETVEKIATRQTPEADSHAALTAIEHVRFSGIFDALSQGGKRYILAAAQLYNALDYLFAGNPPEEALSPKTLPEAPSTPDDILSQRVKLALQESLTKDPQANLADTLEALFETYPLDPRARFTLILSLTEAACQSAHPNALQGLNRLISERKITLDGTAFQQSQALPYIILREDPATIAEAVQALVNQKNAWVCVPALGWSLREMARQSFNPWEDRHLDVILRGLMGMIEDMARSYWRLPCQSIVGAAVELLTHADKLSDGFARRIEAFCLGCFSLSPSFWARTQAAEAQGHLTLSLSLQTAAAAFETLSNADQKTAPNILDAALRHLEAQGSIEAPRWRLELLGPGGVGSLSKKTQAFQAISSTGLNRGDVSLRTLAFPGNQVDDPAVTATARTHLQTHWNNVERAPYYNMQSLSSRGVHALTVMIDNGEPESAVSERLIALQPYLRKISGQLSGFLGIALMLTLIDIMTRRDMASAADRVLAQVGRILLDMPEPMRLKVLEAACVQSALATLQHGAQYSQNATALAALALFPNRPDKAALYPEAPLPVAQWQKASLLFNTLVTVFSCKPYLDSRVEAMRKGWLSDLDALGIPYVIIVGDGDGSLQGDVVHLDAPDNYEGLPHKTLAAVDWVYNNTTFDHMLKIDDDCFLNVEEYFHSLSYRKFHYYGRSITRKPGQMNRTWHHWKSQSQKARTELDKSPEPSSYADGGGGYTLSRTAMQKLLSARDSAEGWQLIDSSYMEDKMVGDLLSQRHISIASEDYYATVWRRTHGPARQVMLWDNYFLPSAASPCKMAHLDNANAQGPTHAARSSGQLFPRKLWPSFQKANLGFDSNQLELLSDDAHLAKLNKAELAVICTCRNEMLHLPAYLAHYRKLGVKCFLFVDNVSDDGTREFLLEQKDCVVFSADTNYPVGRFGLTWQVTLMSNLRQGLWSLIADADELLVFPGWEKTKLAGFLKANAKSGVNAYRANLVDMYPKGPLSKADLSQGDPFKVAGYTDVSPIRKEALYRGPYSNDTTRISAVRHRLVPNSRPLTFLAQKYALVRYNPAMRFANGLHFGAEMQIAEQELILAHFKYDAGFAERATTEAQRGKHFNAAEEYHRYVKLLSDDPDPSFYDKAVSVPWQEADIVKHLLN